MRGLKITEKITGRETESFKAYLREVSQIKTFPSAEAERECATKAFNGDEKAIQELVSRNLRFVISVAKQYQKNNVSLEDLVNEGNCGLLEAAKRFDPSTGNKFISYAVWYIRKDIMSFLSRDSRTIKLPINKVNSMVDFNNKIDSLRQDLGRDVCLDDLFGSIDGYTDSSIEDLFNIQNHSITSMDTPVGKDEDGGSLYDLIASDEFKPTDHLVNEENLTDMLELAMGSLNERAKQVIKMYFGIGINLPMSLSEIGDEIGMTREGVRQIKEKSLKIMKVRARRLGLKELMF